MHISHRLEAAALWKVHDKQAHLLSLGDEAAVKSDSSFLSSMLSVTFDAGLVVVTFVTSSRSLSAGRSPESVGLWQNSEMRSISCCLVPLPLTSSSSASTFSSFPSFFSIRSRAAASSSFPLQPLKSRMWLLMTVLSE